MDPKSEPDAETVAFTPDSTPNERDLFLDVLEIESEEERSAFLENACNGDEALRQRVEGLLNAHERTGFLEPGETVDALKAEVLADADKNVSTSGSENYSVGPEIARGGMGSIRIAEDNKLNRSVAIKVMHRDISASPSDQARFVLEAEVLAKLAHPNIVPIYDMVRENGKPLFYSMKLVKGRTLQDIINDLQIEDSDALKHYTLDRLLTIFRKVCDAMAFAHAENIIHRDLKPENIMVGEFGEVLVMDWGLSKILDGSVELISSAALDPNVDTTASASATLEGSVMGTPQYMSPEQAAGEIAEMDSRSDIYSLGAILYAILTLRPPVEGTDVYDVLEKVQTGELTAPSAFGMTTQANKRSRKGDVLEAKQIKPLPHQSGGKVPPALSAVVMKALSLKKKDRYEHVVELSGDIEKWQGGFATSAEELSALGQLILFIKRHKGIAVSTGVAFMLIVVLTGGFLIKVNAEKDAALAAESIAEAESEKARAAEALAVQEREVANQALAKSQIELAEKEFERGKFVESQRILDATPANYRDANWRFLQAQSHDFITPKGGTGILNGFHLEVIPPGDRFVVEIGSNSRQGDLSIFSLKDDKREARFKVHTNLFGRYGMDGSGSRLCFRPSSDELAIADVATGKILHRWPTENKEDFHLLMSSDGETVLTMNFAGRMVVYAAQTGEVLWSKPFSKVIPAFSPDGRKVAVLDQKSELDFKVLLLDVRTGEELELLEATADNPIKTELQFNRTGDRLACFGGDEFILWDMKDGRKIRALHLAGETVKKMSPSGSVVATFAGSRIRLWDTSSGHLLRSLNGATKVVREVAFSPDERLLISTHEGETHVWPTRLQETRPSLRVGPSLAPQMWLNGDDSQLIANLAWGAVSFDSATGQKKWYSGANHRFSSAALHPVDGTLILADTGEDAFTRLSSSGDSLPAIGSKIKGWSRVEFSNEGKHFMSLQLGGKLRVFAYPAGKLLHENVFGKGRSADLGVFCLGDTAVALALKKGGFTIWDWEGSALRHQIDAEQTGTIACLAVSPDGKYVATGSGDRWIRIWDAASGNLESSFRSHWESVTCLKFSPDGSEIASGSELGVVRVHAVATGEESMAYYGQTGAVSDLDFGADGRLIGALNKLGAVKIWDREISELAACLPGTVIEKAPTIEMRLERTDSEGWEDVLSYLSPEGIEKNGWSLINGELLSPVGAGSSLMPFPGDLKAESYQVRLKLRRLVGKNALLVVALPVGNRMVGFELDSFPTNGYRTGLNRIGGVSLLQVPETLQGQRVKDNEPHELTLTVRLNGSDADISATLDGEALYRWGGPMTKLSQAPVWVSSRGVLAVGSLSDGWAVSEVKVKRLDE
ncbi:MAG: serine/threonine-protein kinase [Verrucomicrobiales bacterium]|nr:serine/threonine-protein kinase [Verrucomicrobiales bacterium]